MKKQVLIALALLGLAVIQAAQTRQTGSVSGRVVDIDTRAPIAGAKVGSRATGWVTTDADGRYTLENVAAGDATVEVQDRDGGYIDMTLTAAKRVVVKPNVDLSGVDFRARLDAQISGRVLDPDGNPLQGIEVSVIERRYGSGRSSVAEQEFAFGDANPQIINSRGAITDDRGVYRINSVFAGRHYFLLARQDRRNTDPVSNAPDKPEARKPTLIPTYYPQADSLSAAVAVTPHSLEQLGNIDIRMQRAPAFCVDATITGTGVLRYGIEPEEIHQMNRGIMPGFVGPAGPDGRIRICDLYPGAFRLTAIADSPRPTRYGSLPIVITDADVRGVKLDAVQPVLIKGELVWDSPQPDAVANSRVLVHEWPYSAPATNVPSIPGSFSFGTFAGLAYTLHVSSLPAPLYVKDVRYNEESVLGKPIVAGSADGTVRVVVASDGGTIRVNAAADAFILLLPAGAQSERELSDAMNAGVANENGVFVAEALPPGRYFVLATNDPPALRMLRNGVSLIEKTPETAARLLAARPRGVSVNLAARGDVQVNVPVQAIP